MEQLQSLYRGDSSDSLSNIMGMTYQPQQATSQMANTALSSGMAAGAQIKATAMNNSTQMAIANMNNNMAQQRLRMEQKQNTISNRLNDDKFGLEVDKFGASEAGRIFGQQRDVAIYNQNVKRDDDAATVAAKNAETQRILAMRPDKDRVRKEIADDKEGLASWTIWDAESKVVSDEIENNLKAAEAAVIPEFGTAEQIAAGKKILADRKRYRYMKDNFAKRTTWARDQYNKQGSSFLKPFFTSPLGNVADLRKMAELGFQPDADTTPPRY